MSYLVAEWLAGRVKYIGLNGVEWQGYCACLVLLTGVFAGMLQFFRIQENVNADREGALRGLVQLLSSGK